MEGKDSFGKLHEPRMVISRGVNIRLEGMNNPVGIFQIGAIEHPDLENIDGFSYSFRIEKIRRVK